jgi:TolB-like protein
MTEPPKAVFLSYASQDAEAARRLCEALRAAGIEVWFDQSELRGGDVWDHQIRQRIQDCALFIPVISAHTEARTEGYFRLEWKLAVDRSYLMADDAAFIFPVVIDDTPEAGARVPDKLRAVQWTRIRAGQAVPEFGRRVAALLAGTEKPARASRSAAPVQSRTSSRLTLIAVAAAVLISAIAAFAWLSRTRQPSATQAPPKPATSVPAVIPPHSIAVLPFEDASARKDQGYISDGLAEQLLNLLSKVPGMQVAARTSAFSFKGHAVDVRTIGRQLMVANVLEGSVSKVGNHLRVTAQLERADNGYQIWSETYDRQLGDVFRIQDEIAAAVVKALKVSLLGAGAPRSTGTQNTDAYLVLLQGRAKMATDVLADTKEAIGDFARAAKLDPNYPSAYVELAMAKLTLAEYSHDHPNYMQTLIAALEEAKLLVERAFTLAPNDAQAYFARGRVRAYTDIAGAEQDYRRGLELSPSSASGYAGLAGVLYEDPKRRDEVFALLARARQLDPLDPQYDILRALFIDWGRSNIKESDAVLSDVLAHHPLNRDALFRLSDVRLAAGHFADAIMYDEQALKLDPLSDWTRRVLIYDYVAINELIAARQVADQAPYPLPIYQILFYMNSSDWHRAAAIAYAAEADGTLLITSREYGVFAMRMEAHRSHDFGRARAVTEKLCGVTWSDSGTPAIPPQDGFAIECVAAGDMLMGSGDRVRGERLLRASLADMDYFAHDLKRGDLFYLQSRATALALLGDRKAALAALHKAVHGAYLDNWAMLPVEPAFAPLRNDPEFQTMMGEIEAKQAFERQLLARMRASGRVPDRSGGATTGDRP